MHLKRHVYFDLLEKHVVLDIYNNNKRLIHIKIYKALNTHHNNYGYLLRQSTQSCQTEKERKKQEENDLRGKEAKEEQV